MDLSLAILEDAKGEITDINMWDLKLDGIYCSV